LGRGAQGKREGDRAGRDAALIGRAWGRILAATAVVAVLVALSGGFGSGVLSIVPRTAYWIGLCAAGAAIGIAAGRLVIPSSWFEARPWAAWSLIAACIAPPMTLIVGVSTTLINHRSFSARMVLEVFPSTLATTIGMTVLAFLVRRRQPLETHAAKPDGKPAKFLARMPARLAGAQLWAVEAQDHYLRLHTSKGQVLILMRLSDAVAELEGIEGARTHRSWWVAREAVVGAVRGDGRAVLTLADGAQVPVSRGFARTLRERGWS
jgi:hypothetical protein